VTVTVKPALSCGLMEVSESKTNLAGGPHLVLSRQMIWSIYLRLEQTCMTFSLELLARTLLSAISLHSTKTFDHSKRIDCYSAAIKGRKIEKLFSCPILLLRREFLADSMGGTKDQERPVRRRVPATRSFAVLQNGRVDELPR
jgi:hypothetical protein